MKLFDYLLIRFGVRKTFSLITLLIVVLFVSLTATIIYFNRPTP